MSSAHDTVAAHVYSTTAILGTLLGYLPDVAALMAAIWYAIVIYESKTVQGILNHDKPQPWPVVEPASPEPSPRQG